MSKLYVFTAAAFIVIGAGAFWAGMAYRSTLGAVPSTGVAGSGVSFAPPNGQKPPDVAVGHVEHLVDHLGCRQRASLSRND